MRVGTAGFRRAALFYRYLAQYRYAEALAQRSHTQPCSGWELWAAYRLGLYTTVAHANWDGQHREGGMAQAVSLAACGNADAAQTVVKRLVTKHGRGKYLHLLADALAPYTPELALSLLQPSDTHTPLGLALLLRTGAHDAAAAGVQAAMAAGHMRLKPELWLLASNALGGEPSQQLQRINAYLQAFGLPPVALRHPALRPSAGNLQGDGMLPVVNGPLVSVIMTAYNAAERIGPALDGLMAQTWRNLEVLVVDDASTDDTQACVQRIASADARVRYMRLPCNVGTYVAKTVGLDLARGEFVTCHDSDDWSHPQRIERQTLPLIENSRLVATTSKWVRISDDGTFYARPVHPIARLNPASPLFRRQKVLKTTGVWDAVRTGADSEFHTRLRLVFGKRAVFNLMQPLAFGAHHPSSLMNAAHTGYNTEGMSPNRLAYWEAWTQWQLTCLRHGTPMVMPRMGEPRVYDAPNALQVPHAHIERCSAFAAAYKADSERG